MFAAMLLLTTGKPNFVILFADDVSFLQDKMSASLPLTQGHARHVCKLVCDVCDAG